MCAAETRAPSATLAESDLDPDEPPPSISAPTASTTITARIVSSGVRSLTGTGESGESWVI